MLHHQEDSANHSLCLQSGQVEEFRVTSGVQIDSLIRVLESEVEQHREQDPELGRSKDTSLFHTTPDLKRI